jgi:enamine deaminase RidA (YjgF/YER057c/UK114 family)
MYGQSIAGGMTPMPTKNAALLTVAFLSLTWCVNGKDKQSDKGARKEMSSQKNSELLIPNTMPKSVGYSQVATVTGGTLVLVSGQVALDNSGNVVGKDDFRAQVQQVFENLKAAVEAAGGTFDDVIKLNSYLVDLSPSHLAEFREVRDKYVNVKTPPASTAVQVQRLFRPEFLVEIEAVAVVKNK